MFAKALVLSTSALGKRSVGEITNLMSVDSTRLQDLTPYLHAVWYSFFQIGLALYFLWNQMGTASLGGVFVIVVSIPLTGRISLYLKKLQTDLSVVRDERVKVTNEILAGIKTIKFQAWEEQMLSRITSVRDRELDIFRKYAIAQSLSGAVFTTIPLLVAIATFGWYIR